MCNAKSFRRSRDELVGFSNELRLGLTGPVPELRPRYRIGPKQQHVILRPADDGTTRAEMGTWGLIPPGKAESKFLLTNARDDKITTSWPWKLIYKKGRCLVPADGFFEPEKISRSKEKAPWSYYTLKDDGLFFMGGLLSDVTDTETGELATTYTVITTGASDVIRIHDRMPVILEPAEAWTWLFAEEFPGHLMRPYPASAMTGWRVPDTAKNFRMPDHAGMIEQVEAARLL